VKFIGHRWDIPQLLASCDLFVLPSLYEGLPISVLEAMAAGKPIVATAIGGTDEAVIHGATGLLVPPRDSAALAAAIRLLLSDSRLSARLAKAGKERAMKEFSLGAIVRGVTAVYEELIKTRHQSTGGSQACRSPS
jgi:glycosyltransferase involved in cell wall biosynthesis